MEGIVFQFLARLIQQDAETEYDRERLIDVIYIEASKKLGDQATPGRVAQEVWRQIRQFVIEKKRCELDLGYMFLERGWLGL